MPMHLERYLVLIYLTRNTSYGITQYDVVKSSITVEPVLYDHPLVPIILVVKERWLENTGEF